MGAGALLLSAAYLSLGSAVAGLLEEAPSLSLFHNSFFIFYYNLFGWPLLILIAFITKYKSLKLTDDVPIMCSDYSQLKNLGILANDVGGATAVSNSVRSKQTGANPQ